MSRVLMGSLIAIIALVILWHIGFFLLGGALAITASVWSVIVASVIIFCAAILFAFVLTGIGIIILGLVALIWTVIAIVAFPVVFPILVPLLIILLFISYLRRREQRKQASELNQTPKL